MKPICIITARANSKRLKNKNIKIFFGKPIISYPIKVGQKSKIFLELLSQQTQLKLQKFQINMVLKRLF